MPLFRPRPFGLILISAFFLIWSPVTHAATYYVDSSLGNDANSGTATSSAWKTLTPINSKTFAAGDSVYFQRGQSFSGKITLFDESGTSGNPIVFGAYGTGAKPIILSTGQTRSFDLRNNASYITIQDLELRGASDSDIFLFTGTYTGNRFERIDFASSTRGVFVSGGTTVSSVFSNLNFTGGTGSTRAIYLQGVSTNDTFEDIAVTGPFQYGIQIGVSTATSTGLSVDGLTVASPTLNGFYLSRSQNVSINDVTITDSAANGFYFLNGEKDLRITNSSVTNSTQRGVRFDTYSENVTIATSSFTRNGSDGIHFVGYAGPGIHIQNATSSNNVGHGLNFPSLSNSTLEIENSHFDSNGTTGTLSNGIMLTGSSRATTTNTTANFNSNDGFNLRNTVQAVFTGVTAQGNGIDGLNSDGDGLSWHDFSTGAVYKSIIKDNKKGGVANVGTTTVDIYNNIFTHSSQGTVGLVAISDDSNVTIYHNTFYNSSLEGTAIYLNDNGSNVVKNNIIFGFDEGISKTSRTSLSEDYNLVYGARTANYAGTGLVQGSHSISIDPQFSNSVSLDFTLRSLSRAINSGTTTSYVSDYLGNARYGTPDMGAYEYQGESDQSDPVVSISSPTTRSVVRGLVSLQVSSSDNINVAGVQIYLDGLRLNEEDTSSPFEISWDSSSVLDGSHTFFAVSRDTAGNYATSTEITIIVSNTRRSGVSISTISYVDSNQNSEDKVEDLILENRALFLWAFKQGITLPLIVLRVLELTRPVLFEKDLTLGSFGKDVQQLQTILIAKGFTIPAGVTGFFGNQTKKALSEYQEVNGISPSSGYFGLKTRTILQ